MFLGTLTGSLLTASLAAGAQPAGKAYRIGVLSPFSSSFGPGPSFEAFRHTLRELGYVEGRNVALEYRWADGRYDRLPDLIADLVRLRVDAIVSTWSTPAALATKKATSTIPIVFAGVGDAVGVGVVESLTWPGGNVTGSTFVTEERQDPEGRQAGGSSGRAGHQVRARHQSPDRQGPRAGHPAVTAGAGRSGDRIAGRCSPWLEPKRVDLCWRQRDPRDRVDPTLRQILPGPFDLRNGYARQSQEIGERVEALALSMPVTKPAAQGGEDDPVLGIDGVDRARASGDM